MKADVHHSVEGDDSKCPFVAFITAKHSIEDHKVLKKPQHGLINNIISYRFELSIQYIALGWVI